VGCESILPFLCIQLLCSNKLSPSSVSLLPSSFTVLSAYSLNADRNENLKGNTFLFYFFHYVQIFLAHVEPEGSSPCVQTFITWSYCDIVDTRFTSGLLCSLMRYEPSVDKWHCTTFFTSYTRPTMGKNRIWCLKSILHSQQEKNIFPCWTLLHP